MKKLNLLIVILVLLLLTFVGCDATGVDEAPVVVNITAVVPYKVLTDEELSTYDFTQMFVISEDGRQVKTLSSFVDASSVVADGNEHTVTCTYKDKTATATVKAYQPIYELTLSQDEITVFTGDALTYDYLSLFTARVNHEEVTIDSTMVTNNVSSSFGTYAVTVTFHNIVKTLTVKVSNNVVITATKQNVEIKDSDIDSFDFTTLFSMTKNGLNVNVKEYFLDLSELTKTGDFSVTCNYEDASLTVPIHVILTAYNVTLDTPVLTLYKLQVSTYNFLRHFSATIDGVATEITQENITTNVTGNPGTYNYTVKVGNASQTMQVVVSDQHVVKVVNSYNELALPQSQIATYDFTSLFSLYIDGVAVKVTEQMVDASALQSANVGDVCDVVLDATSDDGITHFSSTAKVKVTNESDFTVTAHNVDTYPNSAPLDLTSLFTVTDRYGATMPLTTDMISGTIDYSVEGENHITLNYSGQQATAVVTVKKGVVIVADDVVSVRVGTDKQSYVFEDDFTVIINGIRYWGVPDSYIDVSQVDFSTVGTYTAKITVPYNTSTVSSFSKPKFVNYEKTITYQVVQNNYTVEVKNDFVTLEKGNTNYDVCKNLSVIVNGIPQTLTQNPTYVDAISCYVRVLQGIDYTSSQTQTITIAIYANGVNNDPEIVSYQLVIESDVVITTKETIVFTDSTLYTTSLFTVTENGAPVPVDESMVEGKVDTFNAGVYYVTLTYKNITKQTKVVVMEKSLIGTFATKLATIATASTTDEEGFTEEGVSSRVYGDLVINEDFSITLDGKPAEVIGVVDAQTISIVVGGNQYTMNVYNGIVVLDPDNSLKMTFSDSRRPFVYFNKSVWKVEEKVTLNYGSNYVLSNTYATYSIDTFRLTNISDGTTKWYGLKTQLLQKTSADTIYRVTWGEAVYNNGFTSANGTNGKLVFDGVDYLLTMGSGKIAHINHDADNKVFANMTFNGVINGQNVAISFNSVENITISGKGINISLSGYELNNMKNGGIDHYNNQLFIYQYEGNSVDCKYYSYKFLLNPSSKTFTCVEKDDLFGYYVFDNYFIYLDGYGSGEISLDSTSVHNGTKLTYRKIGNEVVLTFVDASVAFTHGTSATLYVSDLLNVLTGKEFATETFVGAQFINQHIIDGAVITSKVTQIEKNSDATACKKLILDGLTIATADGTWTDAQKQDSKNIGFSTIKFSTAGCYSYSINITVGGQQVQVNYPIMILDDVYKDSAIVGNYQNCFVNNGCSLTLTKYGMAKLNYFGNIFEGKFTPSGNSYVAKVRGEMGTVIVKGTLLQNGLITAIGAGAINFTDCFTTGVVNACGTSGLSLRSVTLNDTTLYYASTSATSVGTPCTVEVLSGDTPFNQGAIIKVTSDEIGEKVVKINEWSSATAGMVISDAYRGNFTAENGGISAVVDGFGGITVGGKAGTYFVNYRNVLLCCFDDQTVAYKFSLTAKTYSIYEVAFDETLVNGAYEAQYKFSCGVYNYEATTTFVFDGNGGVTVVSVSPSHDTGEYKCNNDTYSPTFASEDGVLGTYTVIGNTITVSANGATFVFKLYDVVNRSSLTCVSTSVGKTQHGYFAVETMFFAQ